MDQSLEVLWCMISCLVCGAGLRDDSRFCDKCGTMLPASRFPVEYQWHYFQPYYPVPADPRLIQEVFNTIALYWNQIDWKTMWDVFVKVSELAACGKGAWDAAQYLRKWVASWKGQRASETEP